MTAKRYQAKRSVGFLAPGGNPNRAVATLDGTTLAMQLVAPGMVTASAASGRAVTRLVAASNASAQARAMADYVCDGVADQVEINAALAVMTTGGTVLLSEGTFTLAAPVALNAGWQVLRGVGMGATTLAAVGGGGAPLNVGLVQVAGNYCEVRDLTVDGNKATNAAQTGMIGVYVSATESPSIRRVRILNSAHNGLTIWNLARNAIIRDCLIEGSAALGVYVYAGAGQPMVISGCIAKGNVLGYYVDGGPVVLADCQALSNTYQGFEVHADAVASLDRCLAQGNGAQGFYINASIRTRLSGCRALSNVDSGFMTDGTQTRFVGCVASGTTGDGTGFRTATGAVDAAFIGCVSGSGNTNRGFYHTSAGRASYLGCRALANPSYGFQVDNGTAHISGCTVYGVGATGGLGILVGNGSNHVIDGCRVENVGNNGIHVDYTTRDVQVTNNAVYAAGLLANNSYWGIVASGDTTLIAGNTVRDGAGTRLYAAVGIIVDADYPALGHNGTAGAGVSYEVYDNSATTRRVAKLQLDYATATDLFSGLVGAAGATTVIIPNQTFRVDNRDSLVEILVRGSFLVGANPLNNVHTTYLVIDGGAQIKLGCGFQETGNWQNPLAGSQPHKLTGLTPGTHTVRLELKSSAQYTVYFRGAAFPDYEHVGIQVMEYKQ